ncbi:MAG TPA: thrombospondin type 3 repeat-containing protein [Polyangiaceae bacterium]|jgi:hypothetical protein|nr:thrombospondin type 3 repeat-containing protein [Polyangiaceae bacterium]
MARPGHPGGLPALAGLAVALAAGAAAAQTVPSIDTRTWRPSSDADASMILEPANTPGPWRWNLGAWAQYAQDPVVYRDRNDTKVRPVAHFVGLDLALGLGLGKRFAVGVALPLALWQNGETLPAPFVHGGNVPATALGDGSVMAKATLLSNDRGGIRGGLGLAALADLEVPTGNRAAFLSNGEVAGSLSLLAEYAVEVGALRAELGYSARAGERTWPGPGLDDVARFGQAIPWTIGLVVRPKLFASVLDAGDRQLWELAAQGSLPGGPIAPFSAGAARLSPALLALDDRIALGARDADTRVLVGAEVGLDGAIGVPTVRAMVAFQWSPRRHDRDGDGVPDERDECPDLPEDRDGVQDADGCPEDDADGDGILDTDDACPLVPGVPSDDRKKNGCPDGEKKP